MSQIRPGAGHLAGADKSENLAEMKFMNRMTQALSASLAATSMWRVFFILIAGAVAYLALTPAPPLLVDTGWDKANHILAFGAMAFAAFLSCRRSNLKRMLLLGLLFGYGGLIEILQMSVPNRMAEWGDLLADTVGIASGAAAAALVLYAIGGALRTKR